MKHIILCTLVLILCGAGYYYYVRQPKDMQAVQNDYNTAKSNVINTTNIGIDDAIQSGFKGVGAYAPIYYVNNGRSYGASQNQNICNDTTSASSIGSIIANIQKYTQAVSCAVDTDYPSRSFTIVAASKANPGKYFCTDQAGGVSLIDSISYKPFEQGVHCK